MKNFLTDNKFALLLIFSTFSAIFYLCFMTAETAFSESKPDVKSAIEKAIFMRTEFFGASAIVPFPTVQARENLANLQSEFPAESELFVRLAEFDEKLGNFENAEKNLRRAIELDAEKRELLADFYANRGNFEKENETLEKVLSEAATIEKRLRIFGRIIENSRLHDLAKYRQPDFYQAFIAQNPQSLTAFETIIEEFEKDGNLAEALKIIRDCRKNFPAARASLLETEIRLLLAQGKSQEAESVYVEAFNPFWTNTESDNFYDFLSRQDRFRAYGAELKEKNAKNPADFAVAMRLIHFQNYEYRDTGNDVIKRLETARRKQQIEWQTDEIITVARLAIKAGDGNTAARFLYTLHTNNAFKTNPELRAKTLYQLFELLADAENQRLAMTNGDLKFYADVARSDSQPGITTGVLSLIFSDAKIAQKFENKEQAATKFFNLAAAFRIFETYKNENPQSSPELAQMYLDLIRLYTLTQETAKADELLAEFVAKFAAEKHAAPEFPRLALKLADAFLEKGNLSEARRLWQQAMDVIGRKTEAGKLFPATQINDLETTEKPFSDFVGTKNAVQTNQGINISKRKEIESYYDDSSPNFTDFLGDKNAEENSYPHILARLLDSFTEEEDESEILAIYTTEIAKYPSEERLYEQFLTWLETAKLTEKQLEIYRRAAKKFPTRNWQDRLARWFLSQKRETDFLDFSREILEKADNERTQNFLTEFIAPRLAATNAHSFDQKIYLAFYENARLRFPHNKNFVNGLLYFYDECGDYENYRRIAAEHFFDSPEIRSQFLKHLATHGELETYLQEAEAKAANGADSIVYKLFRADAAIRAARFENALPLYRELLKTYPTEYIFTAETVNLTRSFGQKNRKLLQESAETARAAADFRADAGWRTTSGEIFAELGDYQTARDEWRKIPATSRGRNEIYLETASVFWDYFQYDEALETIEKLRVKQKDARLYAFQAGAIYDTEKNYPRAMQEYAKSLDALAENDEKIKQNSQAKARLTQIYNHPQIAHEFRKAFLNERKQRKDASGLVLAFAEILQETEREGEAVNLLKSEISHADAPDFLENAKQIFTDADDKNGVKLALQRLVKIAETPKKRISARLNYAQFLSENGATAEAAQALRELSENFPQNFGVLRETADFYWRIGKREQSLATLKTAMTRADGADRFYFARKAAVRFISLNRLDEAEKVLANLHAENPRDTEIFAELAGVYVRRNNAEKLRQAFDETLQAIKNDTNSEPKEIRYEIADLRNKMIYAFTKLKDYRSAIAQHIEIINREPENEETTEAAILYAKRYGGGEILRDYYAKTAREAFKNYRWFLVSARIAEAAGDAENALVNYDKALENQPENIELYAAKIAVFKRLNNLAKCAEIYEKILELTNDEPQYLKQAIENLEKLGRQSEAAALREKLPPAEKKPKPTLAEQFSEARKLRFAENAESAEAFAQAFAELLKNPLAHEVKTADLQAFVETSRREKSLAEIVSKLWELREKLLKEAEKSNAKTSAEARKLLQTLDNALPEAVGNTARIYGTGEELAALFADLDNRIKAVEIPKDKYGTLSMLQNLARKSGFGSLEEQILLKRQTASLKAREMNEFRQNLQLLLDFYDSRGAFEKSLNLLEKSFAEDSEPENFPYRRRIADSARRLNQTEKELAVLREYFNDAKGKIRLENDDLVARYLEILATKGESGRDELRDIARQKSPFYLQIVNFFIARKDVELTSPAIENTPFGEAWRRAKHAETILALREFAPENECVFINALQLAPIGELVAQKPLPAFDLSGTDWFRTARNYGVWLAEKERETPANISESECFKEQNAQKFLPAMTENRPHDFNEQFALGVYYLEKNSLPKAIEHLQIAAEIDGENTDVKAQLGTAFFKIGNKQKAAEIWAQMLEKPNFGNYLSYQKTLTENGLERDANEKLLPHIVSYFDDFGNREHDFFGEKERSNFQDAKDFIRSYAAGFNDEQLKTYYLIKLCESLKENFWIPKMLLEENSVRTENQNPVYEILINRAKTIPSYKEDAAFREAGQKVFTPEDAENLLDQETAYEPEMPESEKLELQAKYLAKLLKEKNSETARKIVTEAEADLKVRFARPVWLRLAEIHLSGNAPEKLKKFVGITVIEDSPTIIPPSLERLNLALEMLETAGDKETAENLREAFYLRNLAFEKFELATFGELAKINFQRGKPAFALEILQKAVAIADAETSEIAKAEILAWEAVKNYEVNKTKIVEDNQSNTLKLNETLSLSAEIAERFSSPQTAIEFRRKLRTVAPEDFANRAALVELLRKTGNTEEAQNEVTEILNDKSAPRRVRWEIVSAIYENLQINGEFVEKIKAGILADSEMQAALEAVQAVKNGKAETAKNILSQYLTTNSNALAEDFAARIGNAEAGFVRALIAEKDAVFVKENPLASLMRIYAQNERHFAVLKIAETLALKEDLLLMAATSAEKTGNFAQAVEFLQKCEETVEIKEKIKNLQMAIEAENVEKAARLTVGEAVTVAR